MTSVLIAVGAVVVAIVVVKVGINLLLRRSERTADTPKEAASYKDLRENPPPTKILPDGDSSSPSHTTYT